MNKKDQRIKYFTFGMMLLCTVVQAQKPKSSPEHTSRTERPGLVVGIVVDQMRYDYLFRYWDKFGDGGFKRLVTDGYLCKNANYSYVPTYTAPGHACIFTGTTPSINGIISNDWFDRRSRKSVYCVGDTTVKPVGTTSISGKMSPDNLLSTTVTDELRLATNFRSKVIGISLKDRGAILPAGHTANAAYWHDPYSNNWISSTYYENELPLWVQDFNRRKISDSLLSKPWNTLLPLKDYTESTEDDNRYEGLIKGELKPVFPHDLPALKATDSELIRKIPAGNTFTRMFAEAAVDGERLGNGEAQDFLTLSFSSTDYVGHQYGINAIETEDTYLRLDIELAHFLSFLDAKMGKGNYLLFLTADHGASANPEFNKDKKIPSGNIVDVSVAESLKKYFLTTYGDSGLVLSASPNNIFLNREMIEEKKLNLAEMQERCARFAMRFEGVADAATATDLSKAYASEGLRRFMQNGYNPVRSADVMILLQPGWIDWYVKTGTTHGAAWSYDTHVPLIFFGSGIPHGSTAEAIDICDVAPTISTLLNIEFPSGNRGRPIPGLTK